MASPLRHTLLPAALLTLVALAMRIHNAIRYPADWGFDATFNWQYIYALTNDWSLPDPSAGWATGDPPLFYYGAALVMRGLRAVGAIDATVLVLPLLSALEGLAIAALAVLLVRRADPGNTRRAWLAGGLL
ncbi:MAG: hypothetical protein V3U03_02675, partial [Myxococcota bacterium]